MNLRLPRLTSFAPVFIAITVCTAACGSGTDESAPTAAIDGGTGTAEPPAQDGGGGGGPAIPEGTEGVAAEPDGGGNPSADADGTETGAGSTSGDGGEPEDGEPDGGAPPAIADYRAPGPYLAGNTTFVVEDTERGRTLTVEIWYPAVPASAAPGEPIENFVAEGPDREQFANLAAAAPAPCTNKVTRSIRDAAPSDVAGSAGRFPVVAFSHCFECARFSSFSVAEHLATHGIAVVAPDHTQNTLVDSWHGQTAPIDAKFLAVRTRDIRFTLDAVLDDANPAVPEFLRGRFDGDRVGVMGHSYGAATTGSVLARDPRPKAGLALATPMENPLLPPTKISEINVPVAFLLAQEDNSITEAGNTYIRNNFHDAQGPAWLLEIKDAGHWSVSDICALTPAFTPGCGEDTRQTAPGDPFTYIGIELARELTRGYAAAFFVSHLAGTADAAGAIAASVTSEFAQLQSRNTP